MLLNQRVYFKEKPQSCLQDLEDGSEVYAAYVWRQSEIDVVSLLHCSFWPTMTNLGKLGFGRKQRSTFSEKL